MIQNFLNISKKKLQTKNWPKKTSNKKFFRNFLSISKKKKTKNNKWPAPCCVLIWLIVSGMYWLITWAYWPSLFDVGGGGWLLMSSGVWLNCENWLVVVCSPLLLVTGWKVFKYGIEHHFNIIQITFFWKIFKNFFNFFLPFFSLIVFNKRWNKFYMKVLRTS